MNGKTFAIHLKYGTIREIPKHAAGWMNRYIWSVRVGFPSEYEYFKVMSRDKPKRVCHNKGKTLMHCKKCGINLGFFFEDEILPKCFSCGHK